MKDKEYNDTIIARRAITDFTKNKKNIDGHINCPVCKKGRLFFAVAHNGRIHAKCEIENCVSWME